MKKKLQMVRGGVLYNTILLYVLFRPEHAACFSIIQDWISRRARVIIHFDRRRRPLACKHNILYLITYIGTPAGKESSPAAF